MESFWVGADPGGAGNFGLAFLYDGPGAPDLMTVSSVDEAVAAIAKKGEPRGLGADGPLWWSSREGAGRLVDESLRDRYKIHPGTIQSANSLRGSALVGGAMLVHRLRERLPDLRVTESHPKALLEAGFDSLLTETKHEADNLHERDALLAAMCARKGFTNCWNTDLATERWPEEEDPLSPCFRLGPVHYFWPEPLE
ncbi:MAG: DUF429 domain-containing protein [Acidobacteriota bacterium]|nr:DUF429 domain-containing protein [Acidobacteriota bacterium]